MFRDLLNICDKSFCKKIVTSFSLLPIFAKKNPLWVFTRIINSPLGQYEKRSETVQRQQWRYENEIDDANLLYQLFVDFEQAQYVFPQCANTYSKSTENKLKQHHGHCPGVFIVDFEQALVHMLFLPCFYN